MANYESSGYEIDAKLTLGVDKDKIKLDISRLINNISYSMTNYDFMSELEVQFLIDSKYANLVSLPHELELSIIEKGGNANTDIPRSKINGVFVCFPDEAQISIKSNDKGDTFRFQINEVFYPKDVLTLLQSEVSLSTSGNIQSIINKLFKESRKGGAIQVKFGKLKTTHISNLALTRNKFIDQIKLLVKTYGFTENTPVYYADFNTFYFHSINETLKGDRSPITFYFAQENTDQRYTIDNHYYLLRTPPQLDVDTNSNMLNYSKDVALLTHPRHTLYKKTNVDLKKLANKDKTASKSDNFKYWDRIKKTKTTLVAGIDTDFPKKNSLSMDMSSNIIANIEVIDPMILDDWVIGRQVRFDTSVLEYFGFEMTGYIGSFTVNLATSNGVKWDGTCNLEVACSSTGGVLK